MGFQNEKYQFLGAFCVNIMSISYGTVCGWPSAALLVLKSNDTPFKSGPISDEEMSWIGAFVCIGGLVGGFLFSFLADKLGRKTAMLATAVPMISCWIIIIAAQNSIHLCIARFLGGVSGGGVFGLIPLYVTEISEDQIRGKLGSCLVLGCNFGILIAFAMGCFVPYEYQGYILLAFPILFVFMFMFLPETPQHLLRNNKLHQAEKSLKYFRNLKNKSEEPPDTFIKEMEKLKSDYMDTDNTSNTYKNPNENSLQWSDFTTHQAKKAFLIGIVLMLLNQLCGCFAMINYSASIFEQSGSTLSPNISAIIVGFIQLVGSYVATLLVEKSGRKILLAVSSLGMGFGLACLSLHSYLSHLKINLENFQWLPVSSFSFVLFIGCFGALTLPFLVVSEIMPPKIRSVGCTICMTILWIFAFLTIKFLPIFTNIFGMYATMGFFSINCFCGAAFILIVLPETKGKSIDEIMALL